MRKKAPIQEARSQKQEARDKIKIPPHGELELISSYHYPHRA